ncbi:MAG TPA: hypothetical protein VK020_13320 [Microlunatus sp.]|nr:hypothetical protein [Microlunatus sp.]
MQQRTGLGGVALPGEDAAGEVAGLPVLVVQPADQLEHRTVDLQDVLTRRRRVHQQHVDVGQQRDQSAQVGELVDDLRVRAGQHVQGVDRQGSQSFAQLGDDRPAPFRVAVSIGDRHQVVDPDRREDRQVA